MRMLLAPVVQAEEVWCVKLTRIFGSRQPPHCGHVFRQGAGATPCSIQTRVDIRGDVGWVGATPMSRIHQVVAIIFIDDDGTS